jgi:acetylornithine deacetylase/succinyl-diaminopimelate desuccinylase-like protein
MKKIDNGKFELKVMSESIPFSVDPGNELVKLIQKATKEELGFTAKPMGMGGGTYAKNLIQNGILAVGWGPGGNTAHIANEYIEIQQLVDFARLTCLIALEILK